MPKISVIIPVGRDESEVDQIGMEYWRDNIDRLPNRKVMEHINKCFEGFECFKQSSYLYPILSSLSKQTFKDFEIVLVDRLSDTRCKSIKDISASLNINVNHIPEKSSYWHTKKVTPELLEWIVNVFPEKDRYNDKRPFPFPTVCNARNTGLLHAKGDIILYLDDTILLKPHVLEKVNEYHKTVNGVLISRDKYCLNEDRTFTVQKDGREFFKTNFRSSQTWSHSFSINREDILAVNGFNEDYDGGFGDEDGELGTRLFCHGCKYTFDPNLLAPEIAYYKTHMGVGRIPIRHNHCLTLWWIEKLLSEGIRIGNFFHPLPRTYKANLIRPSPEQKEWMKEKQKEIWTWNNLAIPEHPYAWEFTPDTFDLIKLRNAIERKELTW
jgi:glycosyltransferase involved in cell wall biosynthesis